MVNAIIDESTDMTPKGAGHQDTDSRRGTVQCHYLSILPGVCPWCALSGGVIVALYNGREDPV